MKSSDKRVQKTKLSLSNLDYVISNILKEELAIQITPSNTLKEIDKNTSMDAKSSADQQKIASIEAKKASISAQIAKLQEKNAHLQKQIENLSK